MVPTGGTKSAIWNSVLSLLLIASTSLALQGAGKSATAYYKEGLDLYAKGDYQGASKLFLHVSDHVPTHAAALYHLGNCYMKLGRWADAKSIYERCMPLAEGQTKVHCQTAIDHLNKILANIPKKPPAAVPGAKTAREEESMRRYNEQVAELDKRREQIMSEAKAAAQKIRNATKERIEHENANTNQRIKNSQTGERKTGLTSAQEDAINEEMEREIEHVMDIAKQRVKGIQNPPMPH